MQHSNPYHIPTGGNFVDLIKQQFMTIWAVKDGNFSSLLFGFFSLMVLDAFLKMLPQWIHWFQQLVWFFFLKQKVAFTKKIHPNEEQESSILLVRSWSNGENGTGGGGNSSNGGGENGNRGDDDDLQNERVDAVLDYACSQNSAFHLRYKKRYFVNAREEFKLSPDIMGMMQNIQYDPKDNSVTYVEFLIKSKRYNLHTLRGWVDKVYHDYQNKKKNQLGDQRYYFQEIPSFVRRDLDGNIVFESLSKRLCFKMTPFHTFKSLKNVFGEYMETVHKRILLFRDHPEWYEKRGIPYTLGIMLHGTPGCGKTSCIKAIAKDMNRHIFSFSLRDVTTQSQLNNLFFDESVQILNAAGETTYIHIPLDQRIYVIEDIDCMSDVVLDRNYQMPNIQHRIMEDEDEEDLPSYGYQAPQQAPPPVTMMSGYDGGSFGGGTSLQELFGQLSGNPPRNNNNGNIRRPMQTRKAPSAPVTPYMENNEKVTLSYLLNLIDGVLETPGRILIITTNHPERLYRALIRPGRIDLNIEVKRASCEILRRMFSTYYELEEREMGRYVFTEHINEKFTPAEILQILGNHYEQPEEAYLQLKERDIEPLEERKQ